jgi:hypothetical protein
MSELPIRQMDSDVTIKLLCLPFSRSDWRTIQEMHAVAAQKIAGLTIDQTVATIVAEAARAWDKGR